MTVTAPTNTKQRLCKLLSSARLYLITPCEPNGREIEKVLRPALQGGVGIVQLREKEVHGDKFVTTARQVRKLCDAYDALFIVNDHPQLALASGADGVHVGQDDMAPEKVRQLVGDEMLIGLSTHSQQQIDAACGEGIADYIGVGPVFATTTKPSYKPVGLELVEYARDNTNVPFFAIGGIDTDNADEVIAAGAQRLAVVRAITSAEQPKAAVERLLKSM